MTALERLQAARKTWEARRAEALEAQGRAVEALRQEGFAWAAMRRAEKAARNDPERRWA